MKRSKTITLLFLGIALTACSQEQEERKDGFWTAGDDSNLVAKNDMPQSTFTNPPPTVTQKSNDGGSSIMPFFMGYLLASTMNNNSGHSSYYNNNSYPSVAPRREEERRTYTNPIISSYSSGSRSSSSAAASSFLSSSNSRIATNTPISRPSSLPPPVRMTAPARPANPVAATSNTTRGGFGTTASSRSSSVAS